MICEKYEELHPLERAKIIWEVVHCLQNDNALFDMCVELVRLGQVKGLFDNVKILPNHESTAQ